MSRPVPASGTARGALSHDKWIASPFHYGRALLAEMRDARDIRDPGRLGVVQPMAGAQHGGRRMFQHPPACLACRPIPQTCPTQGPRIKPPKGQRKQSPTKRRRRLQQHPAPNWQTDARQIGLDLEVQANRGRRAATRRTGRRDPAADAAWQSLREEAALTTPDTAEIPPGYRFRPWCRRAAWWRTEPRPEHRPDEFRESCSDREIQAMRGRRSGQRRRFRTRKRDRQILRLRIIECYSFGRIARLVGLSATTVKHIVRRDLAASRERFEAARAHIRDMSVRARMRAMNLFSPPLHRHLTANCPASRTVGRPAMGAAGLADDIMTTHPEHERWHWVRELNARLFADVPEAAIHQLLGQSEAGLSAAQHAQLTEYARQRLAHHRAIPRLAVLQSIPRLRR